MVDVYVVLEGKKKRGRGKEEKGAVTYDLKTETGAGLHEGIRAWKPH